MPIYTYKGMNRQGQEVKKEVNAESVALAKQRVRQLGIMIISISEQKSEKLKDKSTVMAFGKQVKVEDLALMTRQLATLVKAKIQIVEALGALVDQVDHPQLKIVLSEVKQKVNEGTSLAKAFSEYPKVFNNVYTNMVEAGEASGSLDLVLVRLADFTEGQMALRRKVSGALTYPIIIGTVGFLVMIFIFVTVIPKISKIFKTMRKELPLQTKICIWISDMTTQYWMIVIPAVLFGWYLFMKYINSKSGKANWDLVLLKLPIINKLTVMINVSRFCSTLSTLLNAGVPILAALRIVKNLVTNVHMQACVEQAKEHVSEGKSMTPPLIKSGLFPPMVTHMIGLGEKTGELQPMLQIVSSNYDDQIDSQLNRITAVLQPIMMLLLGGAVMFIVFSVIVPIMDLNTIRK